MQTTNRTVIVTGASRGIGRAIALAFGADGWHVVVNYRTLVDDAAAVVKLITDAGGTAAAFCADVTDSHAVDKMVEYTRTNYGPIRALINNAGICINAAVARMSEDEWDRVVATDMTAPFITTRALAPHFIEHNEGTIINIASIGGLRGIAGSAAYAAAKGGLISFTKSTAAELGRFNVRVNAVLPGFHATDMGIHASEEYARYAQEESVLGITTNLNECAAFIVFLARSKTVSGQVFNWDSRIIS